jgi:anti-anti-sigma factor
LDSGKSFDLERHPGFARLALNPNLNAYQWADIERSAAEILSALESAKAKGVIVDLSSLDYLGSAQLTLLVRVWKAIKAGGGRMVVLVTAPVVREVLNTAGLSTLWEFSDSLSDAYQKLGLQHDGKSRWSTILPIVGILALGGQCALMMKVVNPEVRLSLISQLGCAAVALAAGLFMIMRGAGLRKGLGIGIVVAGVVLMVIGVLKAPLGAPAPPPAASEPADDSKKPAETAGASAIEPDKDDAGTEADDKKPADAGPAKKDPE